MEPDDLRARETADGLPPLLAAMWWDARSDWSRAHELAQAVDTPEGAWIHAYLHRKEGDASNAGYWYRRAAKPASDLPLDEEWNAIVAALHAARPSG